MLIKRCVLSALNRALSSFTKAFCLCLIFAFIFVLNTTNAQEQNNSDTNASSQSETTQATSTEQNHMSYYFANDIAATMHDDQYSLIDVTIPPLNDQAVQSSDTVSLPIFPVAATVPIVRGNFVLISDASHNGANIYALLALAKELADLGWNSIVMPAPSFTKVMMEADAHEQNKQLQDAEQETPASDTTLEPADATEPAQPIEPIQPIAPSVAVNAQHFESHYKTYYQTHYNRVLLASLSAVIKQSSAGGYTVLFAQGKSAQSVLYDNTQSIKADAIIINNLYWPERTLNQTLPSLVAKHSSPLLDLVSSDDNKWSNSTKDARKISAKINLKPHYRQRQINPGMNNEDTSIAVAKEIYGWLTYLGW